MPKQKHELCAYEMLRQRNMEDNKAMLAKLMADLEQFDVGKKVAPKPKKPREPRRMSDSLVMRENLRANPRRSARFTPYDAPVTRAAGRRGSLASSTCSSANSSPLKENNPLVVKFGGFFKTKKRDMQDGDDDTWDEDEDETKLKRRVSKFQREIKSAEDITEDDIDAVADSVRDKNYNSIYGSTCHQCRQKTDDQKTVCRSEECFGVRGQFCGPCLRNRYGEDAKEALRNPKWECPPCRGICNCSFCRARGGKRATGILIHLARERGFDNVADYLKSLM